MSASRFTFPLLGLAVLVGAAFSPVATTGTGDADRIGVMTHFAHGWALDVLPRVSEAGLGHVRDELYWDALESTPGRFAFPAHYEAYMKGLRERGLNPLIVLTFGNRHYDGGLTPYSDEGVAAYARYAVEVLRHYGPQVRTVEVWNEFNGSFAKGPAAVDRVAGYLRILRAAYVAIKRERPDVVVLGGATSGLPMPYLERLFQEGALDYMDAVSIHPYQTAETPEGLERRVAALQALVARYAQGRPRPVWVTEIGWPLHLSEAPGDLAVDEETQAAFLVRACALLLSADVPRVYWYLLKDTPTFPNMGLVRDGADHAPKAAHEALATLLARLDGARFAGRDASPEDLYSLRFDRNDGSPVRIVWSLAPRAFPVAGATRITGLRGEELPRGEALVVGDAPVYIEGELRAPPSAEDAGAVRRTPVITEASGGFSDRQGANGWSYGYFVGGAVELKPLPEHRVGDWKAEWSGAYRHLSVSAEEQHPAARGDVPVSAVRRWTSDTGGEFQVVGRFKCTPQGDGVGVRVLENGSLRFSERLGGGGGRSIVADFDLVCALAPGGHLDFAVDPGPAGRPDFDVTRVSVTIRPHLFP